MLFYMYNIGQKYKLSSIFVCGGQEEGGPTGALLCLNSGGAPRNDTRESVHNRKLPTTGKNRVLYEQVFDKLRVFCDKAKTKFRFAAHQFRNNCARFFGVFYAVVGAWW